MDNPERTGLQFGAQPAEERALAGLRRARLRPADLTVENKKNVLWSTTLGSRKTTGTVKRLQPTGSYAISLPDGGPVWGQIYKCGGTPQGFND